MTYAANAASALRVLTRKGQSVTRRSYTTGTYDPAAGSVSAATADTTRKGVTFDYGVGGQYVRGQLIQNGDKRLLLDASATVELQDHFIIGGVEWTVVSLGEINPAGTVVLYDLHIRS